MTITDRRFVQLLQVLTNAELSSTSPLSDNDGRNLLRTINAFDNACLACLQALLCQPILQEMKASSASIALEMHVVSVYCCAKILAHI